jgi:hypothetical protein
VHDLVDVPAEPERVSAEDSDQAEPALRSLAEKGRELLPYWASLRRLLLVAHS